jgi:transcriptional regulator with XRE-family HTH domain
MVKVRDDSKLAERFGDLLLRLRESKKLNQRAAARLIGVTQPRLASLEKGIHVNTGLPTFAPAELVARIAATYGYPRAQLLLLAGHSPWLLDESEAQLVAQIVAERFSTR